MPMTGLRDSRWFRAQLSTSSPKNNKGQSEEDCPLLFLPMTGQLSNQIVEGMRKIYELEPFIEMGVSLATAPNTGAKRYKRASQQERRVCPPLPLPPLHIQNLQEGVRGRIRNKTFLGKESLSASIPTRNYQKIKKTGSIKKAVSRLQNVTD